MDETQNKFKVKEALQKDVGRAICRIDPESIRQFGFSAGEVVLLQGNRKTPVRVMPCYPEDRGKQSIQMDGITRANAQVGLEDKIQILKVDANPAARVVLQSLTNGARLKDEDSRYIGTLIDGLPVLKGDKLRASLFGTKSTEFQVLETSPEGVVQINTSTTIRMKSDLPGESKSAQVAYEDIGGLGLQVRRIREMIELPLRFPQLFDRLGIEPPKGVLLHGPPGTGKTLTARAVANETDAFFISISGPEIMGKFYGESEARIRKVFEDASSHAPAIIFIDEIDAIAPKREDMGGEKQVERRVVAQLLALMDGLKSRGQVVVIGATNLPNALDPALRRPGRFDREIIIPIPDKHARQEILGIHTRGMPLDEDVRLDILAEKTHGFVGADLEALTREAAMITLRKILPEIDFNLSSIPYETLMTLQVKMLDFQEAMKEVEPSAIREFFVEVPSVKWEEVGGLECIKQELEEAILWPLNYADLFQKTGAKPSKGILLHGPSGTGKTLLAKAVANESGVNFISIKGPELMNKFIGESERAVRDVFKKAKQASPTILFIDEIDTLIPKRGSEIAGASVSERVIGQFLTEMDGIEELQGVLVLAATNRLDLIDEALLRSGRFDLHLEVPKPDRKNRERIFEIHTANKQLAEEVSCSTLAEITEGMVGADIEFICRKAVMMAIRENIGKLKTSGLSADRPIYITNQHFDKAIEQFKEMSKQTVN